MLWLLPILLMLLSTPICSAATHELTSHIMNPESASVFISNCDQMAGPSKVSFTVFVENQLDQPLAVDYEFFNNATQSWEYAGKLCNIPPNQFVQCTGTIKLYLGGKGNGSFTADVLRLTGRSDAAPGDTYTKTFSFTIRHYAGEREANLILHKKGQENALIEARNLCSSTPSCCTQQNLDAIDEAELLLSESNESLSKCDLPTLYSKIVSAESLLDNVIQNINTCMENQPTPSPSTTPSPTSQTTPSPTPSTSPTTSPIPTETPSPSPSASPTTQSPSPTGSVCPIVLGLIVLLGGFSAFNQSRTSKQN